MARIIVVVEIAMSEYVSGLTDSHIGEAWVSELVVSEEEVTAAPRLCTSLAASLKLLLVENPAKYDQC